MSTLIFIFEQGVQVIEQISIFIFQIHGFNHISGMLSFQEHKGKNTFHSSKLRLKDDKYSESNFKCNDKTSLFFRKIENVNS